MTMKPRIRVSSAWSPYQVRMYPLPEEIGRASAAWLFTPQRIASKAPVRTKVTLVLVSGEIGRLGI